MCSRNLSWRLCVILLALACCATVQAVETVSIVPIVSARQGNDWYRTALLLQSVSGVNVDCEATFAIPNDEQHGTIRAAYTVGRVPTVEQDVLSEIGAIGTLRIACDDDVLVGSLIESSTDGVVFRQAWIFAGVAEGPALSIGNRLRISPLRDVLIAEVAGHPVTVDVIVRDGSESIIGSKRYSVPAFAQQVVNLESVRSSSTNAVLDVTVVAGDGGVVLANESRDSRVLAALSGSARHTEVVNHVGSSGTGRTGPVTEVGAAAFKAAPLRDAATGLVYMRNRWYAPTVGAFLSPDPLGYRDSSNLYSFCAGDPVNCSDPTGLAASVSKSGNVVGVRPDGSHYGFAAEYAKQHPTEIQSTLESDRDLSEADVRAIMARAGLAYGPTSFPCDRGDTCITGAAPERGGDYVAGASLAVSNSVNSVLAPVNVVNGDVPFPTPGPANDRQRVAHDATLDLINAVTVPMFVASFLPAGAPMGQVVGDAYNISTVGMSAAERDAVLEYASRTNAWLNESGTQVIRTTKGPLRRAASAAARRERLRAERAGDAYEGQVGHVPDTAISGAAEPPAGWLDMPGTSNQCCGAGLGRRIGHPIRVVTVDGEVP